MEAPQRLSSIWGWLPAFRAVAETEHLPTAAARLRVSPSALSRSVRLLEDRLGMRLFEREGRSLRLNEAGASLLAAVRQAMRGLDDAVSASPGALRGTVRIATSSDLCSLMVVPALLRLHVAHPDLRPVVEPLDAASVEERLLSGVLDVALSLDAVEGVGVVATQVGVVDLAEVRWRRASGQVPASRGRVEYDAAWSRDRGGAPTVVPDLASAVSLCRATGQCVTGPVSLFEAERGWQVTRRRGRRKVFALHRQPIGAHRRTEALLEALLGSPE